MRFDDTVSFIRHGYNVLKLVEVQDYFPWEKESVDQPSIPLDPLYPTTYTLREIWLGKRRHAAAKAERIWILERERMEKIEKRQRNQRKLDLAWKRELKFRREQKARKKLPRKQFRVGGSHRRYLLGQVNEPPPIPDIPQPERIARTAPETNTMVETILKGLARSNGRSLTQPEIESWTRIARKCADNPNAGGNTIYDSQLILLCCSKALSKHDPTFAAAILRGSDALRDAGA
jgi:hypothetical protein